jgi:hypothetical protein
MVVKIKLSEYARIITQRLDAANIALKLEQQANKSLQVEQDEIELQYEEVATDLINNRSTVKAIKDAVMPHLIHETSKLYPFKTTLYSLLGKTYVSKHANYWWVHYHDSNLFVSILTVDNMDERIPSELNMLTKVYAFYRLVKTLSITDINISDLKTIANRFHDVSNTLQASSVKLAQAHIAVDSLSKKLDVIKKNSELADYEVDVALDECE